MPLNIKIENVRGKINTAISESIIDYGLPAFIVTLAMSSIYRGLCYVTTGMEAVYGLPEDFLFFYGEWNGGELLRLVYRFPYY